MTSTTPASSSQRPLRTLFRYLWQPDWNTRLRILLGLGLLFAAKAAAAVAPIYYKDAVDALAPTSTDLTVIVPLGLILAYGGARICTMAFSELREVLFAKVLYHAPRLAATDVFKHLHQLSLRFHLARRTGGLSRDIERGISGIDRFLSAATWFIIPTLIELALTMAFLFYFFGWTVVLITTATIVLYMIYTIRVTEWRLRLRTAVTIHNTLSNSRAVDSLLNYETVKYFSNEQHEIRRYDQAMEQQETALVKSRSSLAAINIGQAFIISIGLTIVMYITASSIAAGEMSVGNFVLINTYLLQLYIPLNFLGTSYREMRESMIDMEKMFELLRVNREIADAPDAQPLHVTQGRIEFKDVSFAYDERRPILKGISFVAEPGQTVAVVGASGAGKSTLSRLLFRFYDIQGGSITIDGQDIRAVTQSSLRHAIGIVPQDTVLFNDTIEYNIGYGKPEATQDEIVQAARMAQIDEFCTHLPDGYKTVVGERGLKLSGGEKQRVAIARTILKNPPLLVFDEATSALDTHTEKDIQASLKAVSQGRTTLMIAHRLSTVAEADVILVLDNGVVAERGTHGELLARDGLYAALWRRQLDSESSAA